MADAHGKVNDLNRQYVSASQTVEKLKLNGNYDLASQMLQKMQELLKLSRQGRQLVDKTLMAQLSSSKVLYSKSHSESQFTLSLPGGHYIVYLSQTVQGGMIVNAATIDLSLRDNERRTRLLP